MSVKIQKYANINVKIRMVRINALKMYKQPQQQKNQKKLSVLQLNQKNVKKGFV